MLVQFIRRRRGMCQLRAIAVAAVVVLATHGADARELPLNDSTAFASGTEVVARIELPTVHEAKHGDVLLGDVAGLASPDLPTLRKLMRLPLGRLPKTGEATHLDRAALARWIRARVGIDPAHIAWSGADGVDIYLPTRELSGEQLASAAKASLSDWLSTRSSRASVELSRTPRDIVVPAGTVKIAVRPISNAALMTKRMSVWVDVWADDRFIQTVPVDFEVSAYERGYVADSAAPQGRPLDQVRMQPIDVDLTTLSAKSPLTSAAPQSIGDMQLRRSVAAGQVVTWDSIEARPAVARGDWATLRAIAGAVNLESRVEVLEDGRNGQMVHVKLPNATAPMLARVVGPRTVEVRQ